MPPTRKPKAPPGRVLVKKANKQLREIATNYPLLQYLLVNCELDVHGTCFETPIRQAKLRLPWQVIHARNTFKPGPVAKQLADIAIHLRQLAILNINDIAQPGYGGLRACCPTHIETTQANLRDTLLDVVRAGGEWDIFGRKIPALPKVLRVRRIADALWPSDVLIVSPAASILLISMQEDILGHQEGYIDFYGTVACCKPSESTIITIQKQG
jgi:hypothetical protein